LQAERKSHSANMRKMMKFVNRKLASLLLKFLYGIRKNYCPRYGIDDIFKQCAQYGCQ